MKKEYTGINGCMIAIDLARIEAVSPHDGGTRLMVGEYWYDVEDEYVDVRNDWMEVPRLTGADRPPRIGAIKLHLHRD